MKRTEGFPDTVNGCLSIYLEEVFNKQSITRRAGLLTVHNDPHILDKTVDNLEGLSCSDPSLVLRESVESL
jgi:hypothetical protein